jgi:uncharacterized protein (DUF2336 family)
MDAPNTSYEAAKRDARHPDPQVRARVAAAPETPPELLYFLVKDPDNEVRQKVAANPATPPQADMILAKDRDYTVRCHLAHKLVGDGLPDEKRRQIWRMTFTLLETLATDQVIRVRRILSHAFQFDREAPHKIVSGLARDRERDVAKPLLSNSPVLTDDELIEIVDGGAPDWAQEAIAGRAAVSPDLADAIARHDNTGAVRRLIENQGAAIGDATMDRIVARAEEVEPWHAPLANRPKLPMSAVRALVRFIAGPLLKILRRTQTLDAETQQQLDAEIAHRGNDPRPRKPIRKDTKGGARGESGRRGGGESPEERAERLMDAGQLNDEIVSLALASGERDFVTASLALRAGMSVSVGRRIVASKSAKAVTALAWKGKFPMRFAMEVQGRLAAIPPMVRIYARGGVDYPLTPEEMTWHLELFDD